MIQKTVTRDTFDATILSMVYNLGQMMNKIPNAETIEQSKKAALELGVKVIQNEVTAK